MAIMIFLATLVCIVLMHLTRKAVNWVFWRPKRIETYLRKQGLKGTSYKLLFGDTKCIFQMREQAKLKPLMSFPNDYVHRIFPFFHHTVINYGKKSFMWMGPIPMINIVEPELVKEVLSRVYDFHKPRMMNPLLNLLIPGLILDEGDHWAKHRKILNPAFHYSKLKFMLPAFRTSCMEMMKQWEEAIGKSDTSELDAWPFLESLAENAISLTTFGCSSRDLKRVFTLLKQQTRTVGEIAESFYIPGTRYLPTKTNKKIKNSQEEILKLLGDVIRARKKKKSITEVDLPTTTVNNDLLGYLMEYTDDEQQLIDDCKLFHFAGKDSTAILLVWTFILLAKHQHWQTLAREEVLRTFGHSQEPDFEGLNNLKIVTMILHEVLRLYPPATFSVRSVMAETKLGTLSIPEGCMLNLPFAYVHQDEEIWGSDAKEFNPERFSQGVGKATTSGKPSFFAFSVWPRICLGQNYAYMQAKLVVAMVLQRFTFELSPSYVHAPMVSLVLEPQFGAPIILHRL